MNFQEMFLEATHGLRLKAMALADGALANSQRVDRLKRSVSALKSAGNELSTIARRHAVRFGKENSALVSVAGRDVVDLARKTVRALSRPAPTRRAATVPASRRRKSKHTSAR